MSLSRWKRIHHDVEAERPKDGKGYLTLTSLSAAAPSEGALGYGGELVLY